MFRIVHAIYNTWKGFFECRATDCHWIGSLEDGIAHVVANQYKVGKDG